MRSALLESELRNALGDGGTHSSAPAPRERSGHSDQVEMHLAAFGACCKTSLEQPKSSRCQGLQ
jgi:hypothetical protein